MVNLTSLNKLPNTRVLVSAENGSVEVLDLVALFLLKTGTFGCKNWWAISVDAILCFDEIFFRKEKGKNKVTLINISSLILPCIQHKVVILVYIANCFHGRFQITRFLTVKLWARIPFQIGDSSSALFRYLCVSFFKCVSLAFKVKFDQHFLQRVLRSRLTSNLQI